MKNFVLLIENFLKFHFFFKYYFFIPLGDFNFYCDDFFLILATIWFLSENVLKGFRNFWKIRYENNNFTASSQSKFSIFFKYKFSKKKF